VERINQSVEHRKEEALKLTKLLASNNEDIRIEASEGLLEIARDLQELTGNDILTALVAKLKDRSESVRANCVMAIGYMKNPKTIPILRQMLSKDVKPVKIAAIKAMGELKNKGPVESLLLVIKKVRDVDLIIESLNSLGKLRDRRVIPYIRELLTHSNNDIVFTTAKVLCILGDEEGIHFLEESINSTEPNIRAESALLLGDFGDSSHIPLLLKKLFDESSVVRIEVIRALGKIQAEKAVPLLKAALGDSIPEIRANAAEALGNIGDTSVVENLCELLEDENDSVRKNSAVALGKLKDPSVVPYLIVLLGDENDEVRVAASNSLMSLAFWLEDLEAKNRLSIALVVSLEDSVEHVRAAAAETLGYIGVMDDEGLDALIKCLQDSSSIVVVAACGALGNIGDARAADGLKKLLYSDSPFIRWNGVTALGRLTFPDKMEVLNQMLKDNDETVREAAQMALSM
jgi:HEAT repeat protein